MTSIDEGLTVGEAAKRSGFASSALRYYEDLGLIESTRTSGNQRRYPRPVLRRLAFIAAARHVGLTLDETKEALDRLPKGRTPTRSDWNKLSTAWRSRLDAEIAALENLRNRLDRCIGCGCLSLDECHITNPADSAARRGPGARFLPEPLRPDPEKTVR